MEFLVKGVIFKPVGMRQEEFDSLLEAEGKAVLPYVHAGQFKRVWQTWGTHHSDHDHLSLWNVSEDDSEFINTLFIRDAYETFPLVRAGVFTLQSVTYLERNPNDPG